MRRAAVLLALVGALALIPLASAGRALPVATALLPDSVVGDLTAAKSSVLAFTSCMAQVRAAVGVSSVDLVGHSQGTLVPTCWIKFIEPQGYTSRI